MESVNSLHYFIQDSVGTTMDQLSTKVRPKNKYKTDRPELDGRGFDKQIGTSRLVNYQNQKMDGPYQGINIQVLITISRTK